MDNINLSIYGLFKIWVPCCHWKCSSCPAVFTAVQFVWQAAGLLSYLWPQVLKLMSMDPQHCRESLVLYHVMSDTSVVVKTTLTETKTKTRLKGAETESRPRPLNNVPLISMWRCKFNVVYLSQQHCSAEPALCRVFSLVCCFAYEFSVIKVAELRWIKKSNYRWLAILAAFEQESFTSNQNHYVDK